MLTSLIIFAALGASPAQANTLINGAGATFPYPLYSKWFAEYQKKSPETQINYQAIGSGGGIRQFLEHTIDFGATDAPMTDEQLAKAPSKDSILHIPTALGAVVLTYNLPSVDSRLQFTPDLIADIFLGKMTKWNDPRLAKINPGIDLPDQAVLVVHRSDGSGTSNIFTDYLSKVSPEWKAKVGAGTAVNWPTGLGGKGNDGVTGLIKQTPGAVGYVELIYAENNKLPVPAVRNRSGRFIIPNTVTVTAAAAAEAKNMPADFRVSITDPAGPAAKDAYPISSFTYLLVTRKMPGQKGKDLVQFIEWALTDGQKFAAPLAYAPLPKDVAQKALAQVRSIDTRTTK